MRVTFRWLMIGLALNGLACGSNSNDTVIASTPAPSPAPSLLPVPSPIPTPLPRGAGQLYALMASNEANQGGRILHFANAATLAGNVTPVAQLNGPRTHIGSLTDIEVDPAGNRLYAANSPVGPSVGNILVWDSISTKNGDTPPDRVISLGVSPLSVSYDRFRDVLYVGATSGIYRVYGASAANGSVPSGLPIVSTVNNVATFPFGLQIDGVTNRLFVSSCSVVGLTAPQQVASYDNAFQASGNTTINRSITSATNPFATTIDSAGRLVINDGVEPFVPGVRMSTQERILVLPDAQAVNGSPAPVLTITGAAQTVGAHRLNYDSSNDALVVANTNKVLFFDRFPSLTGTVAASTARVLDLSAFTTASATGAPIIFGCTDAAIDPSR